MNWPLMIFCVVLAAITVFVFVIMPEREADRRAKNDAERQQETRDRYARESEERAAEKAARASFAAKWQEVETRALKDPILLPGNYWLRLERHAETGEYRAWRITPHGKVAVNGEFYALEWGYIKKDTNA